MKKSEQKKLNAARKGETKQRRHKSRCRNSATRRAAKHQAATEKLFRKFDRQRQTDGLTPEERDAQIKDQLRHNMEILEAIERQRDEEESARARVNAELESQGFSTLEEKMEHLQQQVAERQRTEADETKFGMSGSADVGFAPVEK